MEKFTKQYLDLRKKYPADVLILVLVERDGEEFFEAYNEDAETIGDELGFYVVTYDDVSRTGFPADDFEKVTTALIRRNHRVVICEEPVLIDEEEQVL